MKDLTSIIFLEVDQFIIASTLFGSTKVPSSKVAWWLNPLLIEFTLAQLGIQSMLPKYLQHHFYILFILFFILRINKNDIQGYQHKLIEYLSKKLFMRYVNVVGALVRPNDNIVNS